MIRIPRTETDEGDFQSKVGHYLTWSEVEGYIQATLYDKNMKPLWVFSGLYGIDIEGVNVKIRIGIPEVVESVTGGNLTATKERGLLKVEPEKGVYVLGERPVLSFFKKFLEE